jgi:hypothetical protein
MYRKGQEGRKKLDWRRAAAGRLIRVASYLKLDIVAFVDHYQPGIVACEFLDAEQRIHKIVDKQPYFSEAYLDEDSEYPQPGFAPCEILARWTDASGRQLVRININHTCALESSEGVSEFVVPASAIVDS